MSIDPAIALGFRPSVPNFGNALNDAGQFMQLQHAARQIGSQNALKGILGQPGAIDGMGIPTPDVMSKVMAIDPDYGMKLRQNALVTQEHQMQMQNNQLKRHEALQELVDPVRAAAMKAYTDTDGPEDVKRAAGQKAFDEGLDDVMKGGGLSEQEKQSMNRNFDPLRVSMASDRWQTYQKTQSTMEKQKRDEVREEKSQQETERWHHATENEAGWQVMTDPSNKDKDNNPTSFRYNARTHESTTLDGQPYKPGSVQKLGAAGPQGDEPLSDDAVKYAATNYREKGILPSFGMSKFGASDRRRIINEAARQAGEGGAEGDIVSQSVLKADQQALTQLTKNRSAVASFENTAIKNGEVLVDLAKKVDSTGIPVFERWSRAGRKAIAGDTDVTNFDAQVRIYGNEVAKIITNPNLTGVLSDSARKEVEDFLPTSATYEQVKSLTTLLKGDFGRRRQSIDDQINVLKDEIRHPGGTPPDKQETAKRDEGGNKPPTISPVFDAQSEADRKAASDRLRANPGEAAAFDGAFGPGSAAKILGDKAPAAAKPAAAQPAAPAAAPPAKPGGQQTGRTAKDPISITDPAQAAKLPPGTYFLAPDGKVRQRPLAVAPAPSSDPPA